MVASGAQEGYTDLGDCGKRRIDAGALSRGLPFCPWPVAEAMQGTGYKALEHSEAQSAMVLTFR